MIDDPIRYVTIHEKRYPIVVTFGATEQIYKKYGDLNGFVGAIQSEHTAVEAYLDALELLIAQGCAYVNFYKVDLPEDCEKVALPRKILEFAVLRDEIPEIAKVIIEALNLSRKNTVKGKSTGKEEAR